MSSNIYDEYIEPISCGDEINGVFNGINSNNYYNFNLDKDAFVTISTCNSDNDTETVLYLNDMNENQLYYNDISYSCTSSRWHAVISTSPDILPNGQYIIHIKEYNGYSGPYSLSIECETIR